jgi:hypothetical protein
MVVEILLDVTLGIELSSLPPDCAQVSVEQQRLTRPKSQRQGFGLRLRVGGPLRGGREVERQMSRGLRPSTSAVVSRDMSPEILTSR